GHFLIELRKQHLGYAHLFSSLAFRKLARSRRIAWAPRPRHSLLGRPIVEVRTDVLSRTEQTEPKWRPRKAGATLSLRLSGGNRRTLRSRTPWMASRQSCGGKNRLRFHIRCGSF